MSIIIAAFKNDFALMMSDGRALTVNRGILTGEFQNNVKKLFRVNKNVCFGCSGDASALPFIIEKLKDYKVQCMYLENIAIIINSVVKQFELSGAPVSIIISGKEQDGRFGIVLISSLNNYLRENIYSDTYPFAIQYAAPPIDSNLLGNIYDKFDKFVESKLEEINNINDLRLILTDFIYNIAKVTPSVNTVIYEEVII
jgi:hypothetical protein